MTQTYEEYLKDVAENGETFSKPKKKKAAKSLYCEKKSMSC